MEDTHLIRDTEPFQPCFRPTLSHYRQFGKRELLTLDLTIERIRMFYNEVSKIRALFCSIIDRRRHDN